MPDDASARSPLRRSALESIARRGIRVPDALDDDARPGIAHIGTGVFHRAHQAVYADDLIAAGDPTAGILGVAMHRPEVRDVLAAQDSLYTVGVMGPSGLESCRVIGAIRETAVLSEDPAATVTRLSDPAISTVTMTVTEDGYHWSTTAEGLDLTSPRIAADLATPGTPTTMPGLLVAALARRRSEGTEPFTIVPCDNLIGNGAVTRRVVVQFAASIDPRLARWIDDRVPFCSTMVDRMVPATTPDARAEINAALGVDDRWPIATESFTQWVLEPAPDARLPRWDEVGVEFVTDVSAFETLKLRTLNATHSAIASVGSSVGRELVSEATVDPDVRAFVDRLLATEIVPSVAPPPGVDVDAYAATVLERFANPALEYTTAKVASGGSHKIVQRLLPIVRSSIDAGRPTDGIACVIAAWLWCLAGPGAEQRGVADPLSDRIAGSPSDRTADAVVARFRDDTDVLGDLASATTFVDSITDHARAIWNDPHAALRRVATDTSERTETDT